MKVLSIPISMHFVRSRPSVPSNKKVSIPILYICPEIVSQLSTSRRTQPVLFTCWKIFVKKKNLLCYVKEKEIISENFYS